MMEKEQALNWIKGVPGLRKALCTEFSQLIPLNVLTIERLSLDVETLARTLREYKEGYVDDDGTVRSWRHRCENLYLVRSDGSVHKSPYVEYRADATSEDPWTGESQTNDWYWENNDEEMWPIAVHFTSTQSTRHAILIETESTVRSGKERISRINITVYEPQTNTVTAAQRILEVYEEYGEIRPDELEKL